LKRAVTRAGSHRALLAAALLAGVFAAGPGHGIDLAPVEDAVANSRFVDANYANWNLYAGGNCVWIPGTSS
jgi:hypothetical protein